MLKSIYTLFSYLVPAQAHGVIFVGIDLPSHQLASALVCESKCKLIAFIDDEPWNNRTKMLNTQIFYPSELLALAYKHRPKLLIHFTGCRPEVTQDYFNELNRLGVLALELNPKDQTFDEQLRLASIALAG